MENTVGVDMKKYLIWMLVGLVLLVPVMSVYQENDYYRIECYPDVATIKPVGYGYEQYCVFENKMDSEITKDFSMLFDEPLSYGQVKVYAPFEYVEELDFTCDGSYGIVNSTHVWCLQNGTNFTVYTGTERYLDPPTVYYNFTHTYHAWKDRTSLFDYVFADFIDKPNAYYVEDVSWNPGESKLVKFNFIPSQSGSVKWDALFGDFSKQEVSLRLDPLVDPSKYVSDWIVDNTSGTNATIVNSDVLTTKGFNDAFKLNLTSYYSFDYGVQDDYGGLNGIAQGALVNTTDCLYGSCYWFNGSGYIDMGWGIDDVSKGVTVCAWVKTFLTNPSVRYDWFGNTETSKQDWVLSILGEDNDQFRSFMRSPPIPPENTSHINGTTDVADGIYHYLCLAKNSTGMVLYVDGVNEADDSVYIDDINYYGRHDFIGARNDGGIPLNFFIGFIDELGVWARELNKTEIQNLTNGGSGVGYYQSGGDSVYNASNFEVNWRLAQIDYFKNNVSSNISFTCGEYTTTFLMNTTTNGSFIMNCSDGETDVNMTYVLYLGNGSEFYSLNASNSFVGNINITFKDSASKALINFTNVSIDFISDLVGRNYFNDTGYVYVPFLEFGNYTFRYSGATDYPEKFGYFDFYESGNLTLYLTNASIANNVTVNIIDENGDDLQNAVVKALRYDIISNAYLLDESGITGADGNVYFNLALASEFYKFIVEYPGGTTIYESTGSYIYETSIQIQVVTTTGNFGDYYKNFDNVDYYLYFYNATNVFSFSYNDPDGLVTEGCLDVYTQNYYGLTLYNSSCIDTSSGVVYVVVEANNGTTYKAVVSVTKNGILSVLDEAYKTFSSSNVFSNIGLLFSFFLVLIGLLLMAYNLIAGLIFMDFTLLFTRIIGFNQLNFGIIVGIIIVSIIFMILVDKK